MKHILLLSFAFLFSSFLHSQDTIHIENHYGDGELFDVYQKNAKEEKIGSYVQYSRFGKKYIAGQYNNGIPVGTWNYYSSDTSGRLVQTLNFDTHKELYVDSLRVNSLICGPRFFGGRMAQAEYISRRIQTDFTQAEKDAYRDRPFVILFSIDPKTLKVVGASVEDDDLQEPFKSKLLAIVNEMPAWLPPVCKGKTAVWRFSVGIIL